MEGFQGLSKMINLGDTGTTGPVESAQQARVIQAISRQHGSTQCTLHNAIDVSGNSTGNAVQTCPGRVSQ